MTAVLRGEPTVVERAAQPYVGVRKQVPMDSVARVADPAGTLDVEGCVPFGHPRELVDVVGDRWDGRVEVPDMNRWETEVALRPAEGGHGVR